MRAPFVWIFVFFSAGILIGASVQVSVWILCAALLIAGVSLRSPSYRVAFCAQAVFLILLGANMRLLQNKQYENHLRALIRQQEMETVCVTGYVATTPEIAAEFFAMNLEVESLNRAPVTGVVRLTVSDWPEDFPVAGDKIETFARLRIPHNFRSEGAFDYERYLRKEGIHAVGTVKSSKLLHKIGQRKSIQTVTSGIRLMLIRKMIAAFDPQNGGMLRALWLDDRSGLTQNLQLTMIDAGVFHVIAISGFHVAVVIAILFFLLRRVVCYKIALVIVSVLLLFYFLLLEGRSSITRSVLTFLILAFASWRREKAEWVSVYFLSALCQLVLNPLELFDTGYHLTYLSTGAILFVAVPVSRAIRLLRKIYIYPVNFLITMLSVQFVLGPYQAMIFHKIPFASILANCIAIPISSGLIGIGMFVLPAIHPGSWIVPLLQKFLNAFIGCSSFFSGMWVQVIASPCSPIVFVFYAFLIGAIVPWKRGMRIIALLFCIGSFVVLVSNPVRLSHGEYLRVHFIDVGQGDAILLEYPDGTYDLVDAGGFFNSEALDTGISVLLPYLAQMKVQRLHRVFLTHAHADHMNGFITLLKYIPAEEFYVTRKPIGEAGFQRLLVETMISPQSICRQDVFHQGSVKMQVLAPADNKTTAKVANDDSLVLLMEYAGKKVLLTGDMEAPTERMLAYENIMKIDYIKVPHHGSKSSSTSELLQKTRPRAAFISVGRNNWFGHPNPDVIARYRESHALIYRTDQLGTIRLTIRADEDSIDTFSWDHL